MSFPHLKGLTALAVGLMACQGSPSPATGALPPASQAAPTSSLLRFARPGGTPRLYDGPTLSDNGWRAQGRLPAVQMVVGFDQDQGLAYAVDSSNGLFALDMGTSSIRTLAQGVRGVVLGPEGTLWVVNAKDSVFRIRNRIAERLDAPLPSRPAALYGTADRQLIAIEGGDSARALLVTGSQPSISSDLPTTHTAASPWGDLVAAAAPTGVFLWAPRGNTPSRRIRVSGTPTSVRFSASGHRIYVARESRDVAVIDRYAGERAGDISLPGAAAGLRVAPYGGWMLAHAAVGDTTWVINLATDTYVGSVSGPWAADLPTVFGDATLLIREGKDVVARDLAREGFPETGRLKGGAVDLYLPLPWTPREARPEPSPSAPSNPVQVTAASPDTEAAGDETVEAPANLYLQVSRSQNPAWAQALANEIRDDGFPALVLTPSAGEEAYRVVVGPYPSREAAESAGRQLGRPSFIYHP